MQVLIMVVNIKKINNWLFRFTQDWDFPHFKSAIDIKMPGVNTAHIKFDIPKCLKKEVWRVHITGTYAYTCT